MIPRTVAVGLCAIAAMLAALSSTHKIGPSVVGVLVGGMAILCYHFLRKTRPLEFSGAVRTAVAGFFVLCVIAGAFAALAGTHMIGAAAAARSGGIVIGAMAILTGNFLPKTRALQALANSGAQTRAAERAIGWILVLAGVAFVVLFAFAPLARARSLAAAAGIGALLLLAATSIQLVIPALTWRRTAELGHDDMIERRSPRAHGRRLMISLLVAFLWVFTTACMTFLTAGQPQGDRLMSWMTMTFGIGVTIFVAFRSRRGRLG